jgi:hypothetical protein
VKRAIITIAALLLCAAIGSARAQTPAQAAKFSRYLSTHPGVAQRLAANQGMTNVPSYLAGYPGAQNYSSAYQAQYMRNLATYQNYLSTHPGLAAQYAGGQGLGNVPSYLANPNYPGQYPYPDPTQQLAGNPLMALVAPFMGSSSGPQNYPGGYGGNVAPIYQPSYAGTPYSTPPPQWGDNDGDEYHHWHHHHFDGDGYGSYGGSAYGPYGGGAYGAYRNGGYGQYGGAPMAQAWSHHHFNGQRFFGSNPGANRAWASHPFAFMGRHGRWGRNH